MAEGRIPWTACVEYGCRAGLDDDTMELFVTVIGSMDAEYVRWQNEEAERRKNAGGKGRKR